MDELYRGYRIAVTNSGGWSARITHVRGTLMPLHASATSAEGAAKCAARARGLIDRYIAFLEQNQLDGEPS